MSPTKALDIAFHMEMGARNQPKINQNLNKSNTQSLNIVNNLQNRNRTTNIQQSENCNANASNQCQSTSNCANCGQRSTNNHRQTCPANRKESKN